MAKLGGDVDERSQHLIGFVKWMEMELGPELKHHACRNLTHNLGIELPIDNTHRLALKKRFDQLCRSRGAYE